MHLIFLVIALVGFGAWPLFLVYIHEVFWPSANLGVVGALQLAGSLIAARRVATDGRWRDRGAPASPPRCSSPPASPWR